MRLPIVLLVCSFLVSFAAQAQQATVVPKRSYRTQSIGAQQPPELDGRIDDAVWDLVEWTGDYIENQPDENTPPSEQTKFKILYDKKFLYFAFRCYDKDPAGIVKRLSRRDGFEGDWVEVNIDSYHDKRTAFSFTISVSGVKGDEFVSDNGDNWDSSWNPIWYLKTRIDDQGWTAEVKIPLSQLKFGDAKEQVWGLQSTRRYFRAEERSVWQRVPRDAAGWVSEFGELHGLVDLQPQKQLEIQPFFAARQETYEAEAGNPFRTGRDFSLNGGLDAKIGVTNDLTLDLTINPDFGQVEADPAALALDGFQIFFEEKRPFFVENKNIFDFRFADGQDNLFYSRRIGRSPQAYPDTAPGEFADIPDNTTILGAAKFSGKTQNGWSVGLLESVTSREFARVDNGLYRRKVQVEPLSNYMVGRVQKDFNHRNSYLGAIVTAVNRNLQGYETDFLNSAAYTAGVDFRHNWKDRTYFVTGNFVASHIQGSPEAMERTQRSLTHLFQRADAGHVFVDPTRTSLTGTGGKIEGGKQAGGHWRYYGLLMWRSPELELNDVGFLRQADEIRQYGILTYQTLKPVGYFRSFNTRLEQLSTYDFDGNYNRFQVSVNTNSNLQNNWYVGTQFQYKPRIFTNTILQGGPRFRFSNEVFGALNFTTDTRRKLSFWSGAYLSQGAQKSFYYTEFDAGFTYRPVNAFSISFGPNFNRNASKTQYVTQRDFSGGTRYIMGDLDQRTLSAAIRLDYNINPNLTIQYYGQPFISKGKYRDFNRVSNPTARDYRERVSWYAPGQLGYDTASATYSIDENRDGSIDYTFENPDFSFVQFRSNLVLRWEYIPGSEIFLVWSQGMNGLADTRLNLWKGLDTQILNRQPENIFLLKATYRFIL